VFGPSSGCAVGPLSDYTLCGHFLGGDEISSYIIICVFTGSHHVRQYLSFRLCRLIIKLHNNNRYILTYNQLVGIIDGGVITDVILEL
jgi:hypothetical protein